VVVTAIGKRADVAALQCGQRAVRSQAADGQETEISARMTIYADEKPATLARPTDSMKHRAKTKAGRSPLLH